MTVAVAVKKQGRVIIASDSLVNFGGQRFPSENCQFNKIHRVGESFVAWAGWSLYAEILTAHLESQPPPSLVSEAEVFRFFVALWRSMREDLSFFQRVGSRDASPFADLESTFLLVNKNSIFRVANDMDVTEFQQYSAVGSGSKYALGALRVLYEQLDDPAEIGRRAVQVGIDSDVYCGGPVMVSEIDGRSHDAQGPRGVR